jgi:hypothetical protein
MSTNITDEENICFEDTSFPLKKENVMDYFKLSDFYDRKSINQQCEDKKLNFITERVKFEGIEYSLENDFKDNELYIIGKYYREKEGRTLLGYYYVFKGKIYKAPNLYSILSSNIQSVSLNFLNIFNYINEYQEDENNET